MTLNFPLTILLAQSDVVDVDDALVLESPRSLGFPHEALERLVVFAELR